MPNPKTLLIALFCVTFTASSLALADNQSGGNAPARSTARSQPAHATTPPRLTTSPPRVVADAPARPTGGTQPTRMTTPPRLTPNPPTIVADTPTRPTSPPRLTPNSPTIVADAPPHPGTTLGPAPREPNRSFHTELVVLGANAHALQHGIERAQDTGLPLRVPRGTYRLTEPLVISRPVQIEAEEGAVIDGVVSLQAGADGSVLIDLECRGIWLKDVSDVRIDGAVVRDPLPISPDVPEAEHMGVWIRDSSDVIVERVHVHGARGKGLAVGRSQRIIFRDCVVHDTRADAGAGIYFAAAHDCLVIRSRVLDPQSNALKISRQSTGIRVHECEFYKTRGIGYALFIQGGVDCEVTSSHIEGRTPRPTVRIEDHPHETQGGPSLRNVVAGNKIVSAVNWPVSPRLTHPQMAKSETVYLDNVEVAQ